MDQIPDDRLETLGNPDACLTATAHEVRAICDELLGARLEIRHLERSSVYWRSLAEKLQDEFCG